MTTTALQICTLSLAFTISRLVAVGITIALMVIPVCGQTAPAKPKVAPISVNVQLMTDSKGVDLTPFMRQVYESVKDKALATMPKSVALGDQGVVRISFLVQKDGTLVSASPALPKFVFGSGKKTLDDHAMAAIRSAAPFEHLPESLSESSVELTLTFYYNVRPSSR